MGCLPWYVARDLQWYLVLCTADTLVLKFKRTYSALSRVRHIRANPPGLGVRSYTGYVNWWLKLLITHWKLWGSILLIGRSEVDLDTPCSKRTGISKESLDSLCYHKQKQAAETSLWYHLASHLTSIDQHVWGPCNQIQILFLWLHPWLSHTLTAVQRYHKFCYCTRQYSRYLQQLSQWQDARPCSVRWLCTC